MRLLSCALVILALTVMGCNTQNKDLTAQFDTLQKENDSIEVAHQAFNDTHDEMMAMHREFTEELKQVEVQDSTIMEDVAQHEAILKQHDAVLESHSEIINGHKELKADFESMTDVQMKAQIKQMKEDHDQMMQEHDKLEEEHAMMMEEHQAIREKLDATQMDAPDDSM